MSYFIERLSGARLQSLPDEILCGQYVVVGDVRFDRQVNSRPQRLIVDNGDPVTSLEINGEMVTTRLLQGRSQRSLAAAVEVADSLNRAEVSQPDWWAI